MTETDFQILEWVVHLTYPQIAPVFFTDPEELAEWSKGPVSWPFCGTVALIVCRIYPESLLAYDSENNHGFNCLPTVNLSEKQSISSLALKDPNPSKLGLVEIDLARDQFTHYIPKIKQVDRPDDNTFLSCLFQDRETVTFHRLAHDFARQHPNISRSSETLQMWTYSDFLC